MMIFTILSLYQSDKIFKFIFRFSEWNYWSNLGYCHLFTHITQNKIQKVSLEQVHLLYLNLSFRSALERPIATALSSAAFIPALERVAGDAVLYLAAHTTRASADILPHLNRIFMEMTGLVTFDTRLQALQV
jgi:hypothetical protein